MLAGALGTTGTVATTATLASIVGMAAAGSSMASKPAKLSSPSTPSAPSPTDSLAQAELDAQSRQRARIATGGQTIYTSPTGATIQSGNLQMHTLLGN